MFLFCEVTVSGATNGFMGLILTNSDGEVSEGFGSDTFFLVEEGFNGN